MAANRLPASLMNALDPAAGARRSRLTAARAGAPRCPYISRRSRPTSGQTLTVPSSIRRGELPRRLRAPFARNVIPGAHAADRARGHARAQPHSCATSRRAAASRDGVAFRQGLRERGYIEGKNIAIEYRRAHRATLGPSSGVANLRAPSSRVLIWPPTSGAREDFVGERPGPRARPQRRWRTFRSTTAE